MHYTNPRLEHIVNRGTWLQLQQNSEHIPITQLKKKPQQHNISWLVLEKVHMVTWLLEKN